MIDHSEFIARHHKGLQTDLSRPRPMHPFWVALLTLLYLAGCVAVALYLKLDHTIIIVTVFVFVASFAGTLLFKRVLYVFSRQEKERVILREVIEGSRAARLVTDSADNTVYANTRFLNLCAPLGPPGLQAFQSLFLENAEAAGLFTGLANQARRGLTDEIELTALREDTEQHLRITAQPVPGWAGYIHWRIDDVTRERELDRALREEREKLVDFTDNAPVGFFSVDEEGRFLFVNATLARWLGEDLEDLLRRGRLHFYLVKPPEGAAPYDILPKGGARQVAEIRMKGPAGRIFLASINMAVVHEADGRVRTRGVVHDLTIERAMRQALKASEDKFQRFFEEAPLGIALVDQALTIRDGNDSLARMLGIDIARLHGLDFTTILDPEYKDIVLKALHTVASKAEEPPAAEIRLKAHNRVVPVRMFARKFGGDEKAVVLHFMDLTQEKTLEAQFVQSQKMQAIGQLAGGIAHDFNNLLTAMIGFCDLLLLRHKPGDPSFADVNQIKQNANRAANLVRQLLAFSRQQTLRPRVQDITDIIIEVSHLLRRLLGVNIELTLNHGTDLGPVRVDEGQMEQVLINLAVNGRDAMPAGGQLIVQTFMFENDAPVLLASGEVMPKGEWVALEVRDTGHGMPPEVMARIFEPFFTTKDVGQGTGLGLSTVYGIMRQTGGYVQVTSALNQGTTFTLYLPRASEEEKRAEDRAREQATVDVPTDLTGTARILLVEDEDAVRTFSTRALANKGYEVVAAEHGEAALKAFAELQGRPIDLLVTDVVMPGMDGPTVAKAIREKMPKLKIIFVSGYTEEKLKDYMGPGIHFLPKPFSLKQLAEKVKMVLEE